MRSLGALVLGAAAGERHDEHWLREHLPSAGVRIDNLSARYGTLIVVGPRSREVLGKLTRADLSNAAFPWLSVRDIEIGYTRAIAMRVNYVGELGWELHIPAEHLLSVYDLLWSAGEEFGIHDFGLYAMDSLRLEKCYRGWKGDLTTEYTPFMASLDRFVKLDKPSGFIGQEALRREAAQGPRERFVPLLVDAGDADDGNVHLELADEVHRRLAHDAPVARAHHAADHDDFAVRVGAQDAGHIQVVGDDAQATVLIDRAHNQVQVDSTQPRDALAKAIADEGYRVSL